MGYNFIFSCLQENIVEDEWIIGLQASPWICFRLSVHSFFQQTVMDSMH